MSAQAVTLHIPAQIYEHFRLRAQQTHRSLEAELLEAVSAIIPKDDDLPPDLARLLQDLTTLADEDLWRAARELFPEDAAQRLEDLNLKQQREGLLDSEREDWSHLMRGYERIMLVRAEAAWLLKQRGHDVSVLIEPT